MRRVLFKSSRLIVSFVIISVMLLLSFFFYSISLSSSSFASGGTLFAFVLFLASYQLRKKLFFLSFGSTSIWLQIHIFNGLLSALVFLLHVGVQLPSGLFESILYCCYVIVFLTGIIGWFLSRTVPSQLLSCGEEVLFERIPFHRKQLLDKVEAFVFEAAASTKESAIPEFHLKHLRPFFEGERNLFRHFIHSKRHRTLLLKKIASQQTFLNDDEQIIMQKITQLVEKKDDLDRQYALQASLKYWLFVHVPLTYSLIIFAMFHAIAACAFASTNG